MGTSLLKGLSTSDKYTITACDIDADAREAVSPYVAKTTDDLDEANAADIVIIAVKPSVVDVILQELSLAADHTLVTIAAGVSTAHVSAHTDANVIRVMPNLAAETGNMAAAVTKDNLTDAVRSLLDEVGVYVEIPESQMDIATAVNGSGPAFVFYLIEAMQTAGINGGLSTEQARILAAQTFKGAAETVLRSEDTIAELIEAVCSPNGTTIEGMDVLWDSNADEAIIGAVSAAERRSSELATEYSNE